jgi:hypothetical protein
MPRSSLARAGTGWKKPAPLPPPVVNPPATHPGYTLLVSDDFTGALDPTRWHPYDNSTFGAPDRIQLYLKRNVVVSPASDGIGNSLKLISKREAVGGKEFTAGMLDTKTAGWFLPLYHRKEMRAKISHGQGIWQAWWSTAKNGGAGMVELDDMEIFHAQVPGRTLATLHRATGRDSTGKLLTQYSVSKNRSADGLGGTFFENPTHAPAWHTFCTECYPVTDATGATPGDPTKPSKYVRFKAYVDGVKIWDYVDTQAEYWTTNGGSIDQFWNVYLQGSQINGKYVGHPDDPLGYSRLLNACISGSGTPPSSCATSRAGVPIVRAQFPNTFEIDYHRVWKYTG